MTTYNNSNNKVITFPHMKRKLLKIYHDDSHHVPPTKETNLARYKSLWFSLGVYPVHTFSFVLDFRFIV